MSLTKSKDRTTRPVLRQGTVENGGRVLHQFVLPDGSPFGIPLDWWIGGDMTRFHRVSSSFRTDASDCQLVQMEAVWIPNVETYHQFTNGWFDRQRMIDVLRAIARDAPIPPIKVIEGPHAHGRYILCDGLHRFFASAAAGFPLIPAIRGWLPETDLL